MERERSPASSCRAGKKNRRDARRGVGSQYPHRAAGKARCDAGGGCRGDEAAFTGDRGLSEQAAAGVRRARELPRCARAPGGAPHLGFVPLHDEERTAHHANPRRDRGAGRPGEGEVSADLPRYYSPRTFRGKITSQTAGGATGPRNGGGCTAGPPAAITGKQKTTNAATGVSSVVTKRR